MHSSYGIAFDGKDLWSFGNSYARNVVNFGVNTSSSSRIGNLKNKFLILGEEFTFPINGSFGSPEKKFSINFSEANTKPCLICIIMMVMLICLLMEKLVVESNETSSRIDNFPTRLFLGSISDVFHATESIKETLGGNVYGFFVDYNAIDKSNILDINKYLMFKNNTK